MYPAVEIGLSFRCVACRWLRSAPRPLASRHFYRCHAIQLRWKREKALDSS